MQFIIIILLFKLPLIILSPPPLSLIAKVPQFFENFTILSFKMALGAHMRPYSYMYCAPHRDRVLHAVPERDEHVVGSTTASMNQPPVEGQARPSGPPEGAQVPVLFTAEHVAQIAQLVAIETR